MNVTNWRSDTPGVHKSNQATCISRSTRVVLGSQRKRVVGRRTLLPRDANWRTHVVCSPMLPASETTDVLRPSRAGQPASSTTRAASSMGSARLPRSWRRLPDVWGRAWPPSRAASASDRQPWQASARARCLTPRFFDASSTAFSPRSMELPVGSSSFCDFGAKTLVLSSPTVLPGETHYDSRDPIRQNSADRTSLSRLPSERFKSMVTVQLTLEDVHQALYPDRINGPLKSIVQPA